MCKHTAQSPEVLPPQVNITDSELVCVSVKIFFFHHPSLSIQIGEELLFLKAVSLCHTVQISYDQPDDLGGGGDPFSHANGFSSNNMEYYASSPDEKALVEAAKRYGYIRARSLTAELADHP